MTLSGRTPTPPTAAVVLLVAILHILGGNCATDSSFAQCPSCHSPDVAVFPYWSMCFDPARYAYDGGRYHLSSREMQLLAPEWDERSGTYNVRLSNVGATYGFTHITRENRYKVMINDTFVITNLATGRHLGWREEGGERFLIETHHGGLIQYFRLSRSTLLSNDFPQLPCPLILGARCEAYNILTADGGRGSPSSNDGLGLGTYVKNGVTYFREQSDNLFHFLLNVAASEPVVQPDIGPAPIPCFLH